MLGFTIQALHKSVTITRRCKNAMFLTEKSGRFEKKPKDNE